MLSNEAKTRIFIGLKVTGNFENLISQIDKALIDIQMGEFTFFPEPTFHVTLLTIDFKESTENIEEIKEKIKK